MVLKLLLFHTFILTSLVSSNDQLNCLLSLPSHLVAWQASAPRKEILWDFTKVCRDAETCYGGESSLQGSTLHQIIPVLTQPDAVITFTSTNNDMQFFRTDETNFRFCTFHPQVTTLVTTTPSLELGINYFVANSSYAPWMICKEGQRLNITVLENQCKMNPNSDIMCNGSGKGYCVARPEEKTFKCMCCKPYDGKFCENVNGCQRNAVTCFNSGQCVDRSDMSSDDSSFTCKCVEGFTGQYCQDVDSRLCERNECSNGGECRWSNNSKIGFECTCPPGFDGELCERDLDECQSSPCFNNGLCKDGANLFTCTCSEGFAGSRCEEDVRICKPQTCQNGGTCVVEDNRAICKCPIDFVGPICSDPFSPCATGPCSNHSTDCVANRSNFSCVCNAGYTGQRCDVNIDECMSSPCGKGTCIDGVASYQCLCPDGSYKAECHDKVLSRDTNVSSALENNTSLSSSSSSSPAINVVVGVVVIIVLLTLLIFLIVHFVKSGILSNTRKRRVYAIPVRENSSLKDKVNTSRVGPGELFGDEAFPEDGSFSSRLSSRLSKRSVKKLEKF